MKHLYSFISLFIFVSLTHISLRGDYLYLLSQEKTSQDGYVFVYDTDRLGAIINNSQIPPTYHLAQIGVGKNPVHMILSKDQKHLFVLSQDGIRVIYTPTLSLAFTIDAAYMNNKTGLTLGSFPQNKLYLSEKYHDFDSSTLFFAYQDASNTNYVIKLIVSLPPYPDCSMNKVSIGNRIVQDMIDSPIGLLLVGCTNTVPSSRNLISIHLDASNGIKIKDEDNFNPSFPIYSISANANSTLLYFNPNLATSSGIKTTPLTKLTNIPLFNSNPGDISFTNFSGKYVSKFILSPKVIDNTSTIYSYGFGKSPYPNSGGVLLCPEAPTTSFIVSSSSVGLTGLCFSKDGRYIFASEGYDPMGLYNLTYMFDTSSGNGNFTKIRTLKAALPCTLKSPLNVYLSNTEGGKFNEAGSQIFFPYATSSITPLEGFCMFKMTDILSGSSSSPIDPSFVQSNPSYNSIGVLLGKVFLEAPVISVTKIGNYHQINLVTPSQSPTTVKYAIYKRSFPSTKTQNYVSSETKLIGFISPSGIPYLKDYFTSGETNYYYAVSQDPSGNQGALSQPISITS
ncbi:MAG: hypothetical protein ACOVOR_03190 [Rhabdochlamydiaceae bacterium]